MTLISQPVKIDINNENKDTWQIKIQETVLKSIFEINF